MMVNDDNRRISTWTVFAPVGNYYGSPAVSEYPDGSFKIRIDDWNEEDSHPVSREFAMAWKREFAKVDESTT